MLDQINVRRYYSAAAASQVVFDASQVSSSGAGASAVTSLSLSDINVGSGGGSNLFLVAAFWASSSGISPSMTWNGVSMSLITSRADGTFGDKVWLFGLIAPATGNKTLAASWTGSVNAVLGAISFSGVHQTTPTGSPVGNDAFGSPSTITIPNGGSTQMVVALHGITSGYSSADPTAFLQNNGTFGSASLAQYAAGTGSNTLSASGGGISGYCVCGVPILPA